MAKHYAPTQQAIDELVEAANEMAQQAGFSDSILEWTGNLLGIDGRLWVEVTDTGDTDFKASDQWISNDGHMALSAQDAQDEEAWLI